MQCPECKTETYLDHTTTEGETTRYFYTCPKKGCSNYLKIINGNEEGKKASIITEAQALKEKETE